MSVLYRIFVDGASRQNPGPSSIGVVGFISQLDFSLSRQYLSRQPYLFNLSKKIGIATNNQAEYTALIYAMKHCLENNYLNSYIYMDSLLVIQQMKGIYSVKSTNLITLFKEAKTLEKQFQNIIFNHIPRELNVIADKLANQALDSNE